MKLSVIVVNWNGGDRLPRCLESIERAAENLATEILVVDNSSTDSSPRMVREAFPQVTVIENRENVGFARGAQTGIDSSVGEFVVVLNPDVVLLPGSLSQLVRFLEEHPAAAWVGPRVIRPDGAVQRGALDLFTMFTPLWSAPGLIRRAPWLKSPPDVARRCGQQRGSCMVFRASMLADIGGMPTDLYLYGAEQVLGRRFQERGYEVWYYPLCTVVHDGAYSADQKWRYEEKQLALRIGINESMRQTLSHPAFVVHNLLLINSLLLRLGVSLLRRGRASRLTWRLIKVSAAGLARPQTVEFGGTPSRGLPAGSEGR